jgi:hypothetical protein
MLVILSGAKNLTLADGLRLCFCVTDEQMWAPSPSARLGMTRVEVVRGAS